MWLPKTEELAEYYRSAGEYFRGAYCQAERWNLLLERREHRLWRVRHVQILVLIVLKLIFLGALCMDRLQLKCLWKNSFSPRPRGSVSATVSNAWCSEGLNNNWTLDSAMKAGIEPDPKLIPAQSQVRGAGSGGTKFSNMVRKELRPTHISFLSVANRIEQPESFLRYCKMSMGSPYLLTTEQHNNGANGS